MRKVLLFIMLFPAVVFAGGPKYTYPEVPGLDDEMGNIYHNISNPSINYATISSETVTYSNVSVSSITTATIGTLTYGTLSPPVSSGGQILNYSSATITTSASTTNTSFVSSGFGVTITPSSIHSAIVVGYQGNLRTSNCSNNQAEITFKNGTTDLCAGSNSRGCVYNTCAAGTDAIDIPASFSVANCPSSTSTVSYVLNIRADGSGTTTINNQSSGASLFAYEVTSNKLCP